MNIELKMHARFPLIVIKIYSNVSWIGKIIVLDFHVENGVRMRPESPFSRVWTAPVVRIEVTRIKSYLWVDGPRILILF